MPHHISNYIAQRRKECGLTQQRLADQLNISFQAVSKWENGSASPDIQLLPQIARILNTTVDAIVGYSHPPATHYEEKYRREPYYWGLIPNNLCYEIMKLRPPVKPYRVLDIGCGEGKDAVFLAKNGYNLTAFDIADSGIRKAQELARLNHVNTQFFRSDITEYIPSAPFDIVFSSGVFHYIALNKRKNIIDRLKACTPIGGIHTINVFVQKPFIDPAPDLEDAERQVDPWLSGELAGYYHDWFFHKNEEIIFDCRSGGIPHQHCMNVLIAEKK